MNESAGIPQSDAGTEHETSYFKYDASVRIFAERLNMEGISSALALQPTRTHRKGERFLGKMRPFEQDLWMFQPPVNESEPLHRHIDALWLVLKPHKQYLLELKQSCTVDVFLGYRSSCDHAGVEVPYSSLEMFTELEVPFGLSIIVA